MNNNIVCTYNNQLSIIIIVMGHSISPTLITLQCTSTVTKISLQEVLIYYCSIGGHNIIIRLPAGKF